MSVHGGDVYGLEEQFGIAVEDCLDFSASINPLGMPEPVRRGLYDGLTRAMHYPDPSCRALRRAIGRMDGVPSEWICCGNGASDLIYRLCYALRPKTALLVEPTFSEYRQALGQADTKVKSYVMPKETFVPDEGLLSHIREDVDIIFLCNPNNPTGLLTDGALLLRALHKAREVSAVVVIDEAFLTFLPDVESLSMKRHLEAYPNLCVLRSFTKLFAMPAMRLGYLLCADDSIRERVERAGSCWSVNTAAQAGGVAACEQGEFVQRSICFIEKERQYLKDVLTGCGFLVFEGRANFLFFQAPGITDLFERLLPWGIYIRKCANFVGLDDTYYRIAVKSHEDNEKLARALQAAVLERG